VLVEAHLAAAGYAVTVADGGERALALFQEQPPELVLLDILMPKVDGFETCRRLRALPGGAETPIVFLTALCDLGTHQAALDAGGDDFLTKPINRTELLLRVRSLLRIRHLARDLAATFERLRDQSDELERAKREQGDLYALVEQDIETPLTRVVRDLQLASESGADSRQALRDALQATARVQVAVMRLLAVHRRAEEPASSRLVSSSGIEIGDGAEPDLDVASDRQR
jgi:DNA-binding response OmpR family regulator